MNYASDHDFIPFKGTLSSPVKFAGSTNYNFDHLSFYLPVSFDTSFGLHGSLEVIFIPISVLVVCRAEFSLQEIVGIFAVEERFLQVK